MFESRRGYQNGLPVTRSDACLYRGRNAKFYPFVEHAGDRRIWPEQAPASAPTGRLSVIVGGRPTVSYLDASIIARARSTTSSMSSTARISACCLTGKLNNQREIAATLSASTRA